MFGRDDQAMTFIHRFGLSERIAHWLLAAAFASMLATGVLMGGIGPLHHRAVLIAHVGSAIVLVSGIAALIALRRSRLPLAQTARDLRPLDARDRRWLLTPLMQAEYELYLLDAETRRPPFGGTDITTTLTNQRLPALPEMVRHLQALGL